jgi:hypothetical protein
MYSSLFWLVSLPLQCMRKIIYSVTTINLSSSNLTILNADSPIMKLHSLCTFAFFVGSFYCEYM